MQFFRYSLRFRKTVFFSEQMIVRELMSEHIFRPNGGHCLYIFYSLPILYSVCITTLVDFSDFRFSSHFIFLSNLDQLFIQARLLSSNLTKRNYFVCQYGWHSNGNQLLWPVKEPRGLHMLGIVRFKLFSALDVILGKFVGFRLSISLLCL